MTLKLRYAAKSDVGLLREGNEDSAYAGPRLLAVADGMGGHAHGEVASAGAIATFAPLDEGEPHPNPSAALEQALRKANDKLRRMVEDDPKLEGMGTTLTAVLWAGQAVQAGQVPPYSQAPPPYPAAQAAQQLALVHIGDSRAYLLRGGELSRMTRDHTLVQSLIDEGRIDEEEAAVHPQRSLLLRALDGRTDVEPDLAVHDLRLGDRYLLCSDGLSSVVSEETLHETLRAGWDPDRVVQQLIELANRGGGPDNITCVVADVVDGAEEYAAPLIAGAAANVVQRDRSEDTITLDTSAGRAAALMRQPNTVEDTDAFAAGDVDGYPGYPERDGTDPSEGPAPSRRWPRVFLSLLLLVAALGGSSYAAWNYARSQYYVGTRDGEVVIFRGISQQVAGRALSRVHSRTGLTLTQLPTYERGVVASNIPAASLNEAEDVVARLRAEVRACIRQQKQEAREEKKRKERQDKQRDKDNDSGKRDQKQQTQDGQASQQDGQQPDQKRDEPRAQGDQATADKRSASPTADGKESSTSPSPEPSDERLRGCAEGVNASDG